MMATSERICYLHIGVHKTGTTSIQVFLAANRERFAKRGVFFPTAGSDGDPGVVSHHQLARELNGDAAFDPTHGGLDAVASELLASDARLACISSEDLTFSWNQPAALTRLRDAVRSAGFSPRVVVYLRPQASYCTAVYAENVRHGYRTPFARYFSDIMAHGCYVWGSGFGPPFDYSALLDPFAGVFGRAAILVRRYRTGAPNNALIESFARLLLPPQADLKDFRMPETRYNGSLDFGGVLDHLGADGPAGERLRFSPLGVAQTLRLACRFRAANAALAAAYGVALPAVEPLDLALALPVRRTRAKTRALSVARRALTRAGSQC